MYLGLAYSTAGCFGPLIQILNPAILDTPDQMTELATVRAALLIVGGCAWLAAEYVGPAVSLLRSPFGWRITTALGVGYLLLVLSLAHVSAQAVRLETAQAGAVASWAHLLVGGGQVVFTRLPLIEVIKYESMHV